MSRSHDERLKSPCKEGQTTCQAPMRDRRLLSLAQQLASLSTLAIMSSPFSVFRHLISSAPCGVRTLWQRYSFLYTLTFPLLSTTVLCVPLGLLNGISTSRPRRASNLTTNRQASLSRSLPPSNARPFTSSGTEVTSLRGRWALRLALPTLLTPFPRFTGQIQCEIHWKSAISYLSSTSGSAPYFLRVYTSITDKPLVVQAGNGPENEFNFTLPFDFAPRSVVRPSVIQYPQNLTRA